MIHRACYLSDHYNHMQLNDAFHIHMYSILKVQSDLAFQCLTSDRLHNKHQSSKDPFRSF